ncbi:MAG: ferrous iron transporter B, partial [Gammaproteobacteria bacterium]|nr:ferrous iron transporter B [Gammaproteobacteria bacterium]
MKRIALIGMPNTGKSTFFNRLTGASAKIGNWPGITVELLSAKIMEGSEMVEIVDLPGIYNLHGFSEDEKVARHFIENTDLDLLVVIGNASQMDRQLALVLQLQELNLPMVLLLNMHDEAQQHGIKIDTDNLSSELNTPTTLMSAKYGQGIQQARELIRESLSKEKNTSTKETDTFTDDDKLEAKLDQLMNKYVSVPIQLSTGLTDKLDKVLLHPWFGLPLFFLAILLMFEVVYTVGTPLQDGIAWLLKVIQESQLSPLIDTFHPVAQSFLIEGIYNGVGTVLSFLPIIVLFFLCMAIVEDSGYLARAAFLMDAFMSKLGLDGRSFVMQLMGFGCNVPALMGTRVMRSRGLRLLTMMIIPFSLCSARLQVFVFLTTAIFSPQAAPLVLFTLYLASFGAAFLTAAIYRNRLPNSEPLLLELPPYRFPTVLQMLLHGWRETWYFIREASGYILLGVVLVWFLTHYPFDAVPASSETLAGKIADIFAPVFEPLGMD